MFVVRHNFYCRPGSSAGPGNWQTSELKQVLDADRIIHEQQLGLEWTPPREDLLLQELETFSEAGTTTGKSAARSGALSTI